MKTALLIWLAVAAGFSVLRHKVYFETPLLETADAAVNALQIDDAKHGLELYGNYSRFHLHHPGPAFFYLYAGGEILFHDWLHVAPSPGNAHLFTGMLAQSLFFALALVTLALHLPRSFLPLALLAAAIYFRSVDSAFTSIWPPHVLLMPFLCFLAAGASFAVGRAAAFPLLVLCGGFLFHGHVAQPVFVGGIGAVAVALHLWNTQGSLHWSAWRAAFRSARRPALWGAGLTALFLLPVIIDVVTLGRQCNIAAILGRLQANGNDHKTLLQSLLYLATFAVPHFAQQELVLDKIGAATGAFFRQHWGWLAGWLGVVAVVALLARLLRDKFPTPQRRLLVAAGALLGVSGGLCLYWGVSMAGPMFQFNGYFYYALYFFLVVIFAAVLSVAIGYRPPRALAGVLAVAAFAVFFQPFRIEPGDPQGLALQRGILEAVRADPPHQPKLLIFEHDNWPAAASVALELKRLGYDYRVVPWWGFMFGYDHILTKLGGQPEDEVSIWWLDSPAKDGIRLTDKLAIFTRPPPLNPANGEIRPLDGQNGNRYFVSGLSLGNQESAWTVLPRVVFEFAPLPASHDVTLTFDAAAELAPAPHAWAPSVQDAGIYFNDAPVGQVSVGPRAGVSINIPAALWNGRSRGKLELRFPSAVHHVDAAEPRALLWTAWRIWDIRFRTAIPEH